MHIRLKPDRPHQKANRRQENPADGQKTMILFYHFATGCT